MFFHINNMWIVTTNTCIVLLHFIFSKWWKWKKRMKKLHIYSFFLVQVGYRWYVTRIVFWYRTMDDYRSIFRHYSGQIYSFMQNWFSKIQDRKVLMGRDNRNSTFHTKFYFSFSSDWSSKGNIYLETFWNSRARKKILTIWEISNGQKLVIWPLKRRACLDLVMFCIFTIWLDPVNCTLALSLLCYEMEESVQNFQHLLSYWSAIKFPLFSLFLQRCTCLCHPNSIELASHENSIAFMPS